MRRIEGLYFYTCDQCGEEANVVMPTDKTPPGGWVRLVDDTGTTRDFHQHRCLMAYLVARAELVAHH